ncbi:DUF1842 domain-containing protein [Pseudoalteromonas luteoviolacea]|uniref:DUF1842 domain-containing protein n=1 Tax=Pseudoalteromonas luteoviolacea S4060-1 TaxID=1365257 RepID=A0A162B3F2_9GAMM|nr:DUF1842 domain-containing protein [Pseudoalteromonas luteoviolacea]KZN37399.1 hypothetical protein N480_14925 [Pseudoalteromonas luteoviolacea S2607]KZN65870.1 hypothetical protein N478_20785 [Pseudoalteromonas luteoviolacea S4060-1]
MLNSQSGIQGLFLANFFLGIKSKAQVHFNISLLVYVRNKTISGRGKVFIPTASEQDIISNLYGEFHYQRAADKCYIVLDLLGHQPCLGIPPTCKATHNTKLNILLDDNWQVGEAGLSYLDPIKKSWHTIDQLPVRQVDHSNIADLSQLAIQVKNAHKH